MSVKSSKMIDVINYHNFGVAIKTKDRGYWVESARDGEPTRLPLLLEEVQYIHTTSEAFRAGLLFFDDGIEEEMYEDVLRIHEWKQIYKPSQMREMISNPTVENVDKILLIDNITIFEIIRGVFIDLKVNENADISTRMERVITARYDELINKVYKSKITVKPVKDEQKYTAEDVSAMKSELQEMKDMLALFMASQNAVKNESTAVENTTVVENKEVVEKDIKVENKSKPVKKTTK